MTDSIIFKSKATVVYPQNESTGAMLDSHPGGKDFGSTSGTTLTGTSRIFDGVNDFDTSDTEVSGDLPLAVEDDWIAWMHVIVPAPQGAAANFWLVPTELTDAKQGPLITPNFSVTLGKFTVTSHGSDGNAVIALLMERDFNAGEELIIALSYDFSTKVLNAHLRSKDGLDIAGTATGLSDPGFNAGDAYYLMRNKGGTVFANAELLEWGVAQGEFAMQDELSDELEAWIVGDDNPQPNFLLLMQ